MVGEWPFHFGDLWECCIQFGCASQARVKVLITGLNGFGFFVAAKESDASGLRYEKDCFGDGM